ncbi:MAG: FecR domain-containing protein [Bryobacteraceae bacterium]
MSAVVFALLAQAQEARVTALSGTLSMKRAGQQARVLRLHEAVAPGDELITDSRSEAVVQTPDGSTVRVFPDSHVIFSGRPGGVENLLHLLFGSVKVQIEKLSGRPNPQRLTTPTAVIAVRGTKFTVLVDEVNTTLVAVDEGAVSVANIQTPGDEVLLRAGQRTWVRPGQRPMMAQKFRGRSEQADLMAARNAQRRQEHEIMKADRKSSDVSPGRGPVHAVPQSVHRGPVR